METCPTYKEVDMLLTLLQIAGIIPLMLGLFVIYHIVRPQQPPADTSNRINKIRLVWFALTREQLFTGTFPWLTRDEMDNIHPYK